MTRVYVDISVFTPLASVGVVNGYLDLEVVPFEGQIVEFNQPMNPVAPLEVSGFTPRLLVEHVSPPVAGSREMLLSLTDITMATRPEALKVAKYLQEGFGLYFDEHGAAAEQP